MDRASAARPSAFWRCSATSPEKVVHLRGRRAGVLPHQRRRTTTSARTSSSPAARCSALRPARARSSRSTTSAPSAPPSSAFMKELDDELWALGIPAKTKHNEVAPCQHELAPVYRRGPTSAIDHNLVMMENMKTHRLPPRLGLPAAREALRRHQRFGQAQQLVASRTESREPARPRRHPASTTCSSSSSSPPSSRPSTTTRTCCAASVASGRQRPSSGRQRGSCRRSSPSSWATELTDVVESIINGEELPCTPTRGVRRPGRRCASQA